MKKIYSYLLMGAMAFSTLFGVLSLTNNEVKEAEAASTSVIDELTFANFTANYSKGSYGNFSWDVDRIDSCTSSLFVAKYWGNDQHAFRIIWTKPSNMSYPSSIRYGYSISTNENSDSASKNFNYDPSTVPYLPMGGDGTKQYTVKESSLDANKSTVVMWLGHSYMASELEVTGLTFQLKLISVKVQVGAGTGVKSAYVSSDSNATSGSTSGTFGKGTKVYCFIKLDKGYKAKSSWTLVSGTANTEDAIYRTGSYTADTKDYNFGTISADAKTQQIYLYKNGGGSTSIAEVTYNQTYIISAPSRTGYEFKGWNTKQDGSGTSYGSSLSVTEVNDIILNNISAFYAQWERLGTEITLDKQNGTGGDSTVFGIENEAMPSATMPTRAGYNFNGYYTEVDGAGDKYYNADGTSAKNWDKSDVTYTLYASWSMKDAVNNAIDKIDAIDNPVTLDSENKIIEARTAYDLVESGDTSAVSNYNVLVLAEERLAELKEAKQNAEDVEILISNIGEVKYYESKSAIQQARTAYDSLNDDAKGFVSNYSTLTDAEARYLELKQQAVNNAINKINSIPNPGVYTQECIDRLDEAKVAQGAVDSDDLSLITNREDYFTRSIEYGAARSQAINNVEDLIDAIVDLGEVKYNDTFKDAIANARNALDALLENDANSVTNKQDLIDAENAYHQSMIDGVDGVKGLIDAIGTVEYTQDSKDKIDAAREAFNALSDEQKELVDNYSTLLNAEDAYTKFVDNHEAANNVKGLINAIGSVIYTDESKEKIDLARSAYDALIVDQKALISETEYKVLTDAEATYKALDNTAKAHVVVDLIDAIGTVEYTDACKAKIDLARTAYEALSEDQKELVTNKEVLFDAIELYDTLAHQPTVVDNGVKVEGKDGELIPVNVNVKVEVKSSVKAEEGTTEYQNIQKALGNNQKIAGVYDVKLIRTVGEEETIIQPSDIKEGMIIIIEITLPDGLSLEGLKVLHIHSEDDITYIENYKVENGILSFETDRLSEIAFVVPHHEGLAGWAIALIVIGGLLLLCGAGYALCFFLFNKWIKEEGKAVRVSPLKLGKKDDKVRLFAFPCKVVYRLENEIYKTKEEALK